jgi:glycosyltransferase involved in cell wall biosynthesis
MPAQTELGPPRASGARYSSLLLIIPAYNEAGCIAQVVGRARVMLPEADVLVVDDGSRDATARIARQAGAFVVSLPFNLGIGGAVQTGLKFARRHDYDFVLRIDGDGQHDPEELLRLLAVVRAGSADVAVGSRFLEDGLDMRIPFARRLGIQLFAREVSLLTGRRATDTTSGMTAMNRRAICVLATYMPQDYPEVEGRIILHGAGLTIEELPVRMGERLAGVSSINRWRSIYYAMKVSLAVLLTALKEIPTIAALGPEDLHVDRAIVRRHHPERGPTDDHYPAHSRTQTA